VGTLYQYFRKKEAVFTELQRRELNILVENLVEAREAMREAPLDDAIERLVEVLLDTFTQKPEVARALAENRSQILDPEEEQQRHAFLQQLLAEGLREREEPLLIDDYELATFVVVKTSEAVSVAAVVERPEALKDGSLKRELVALFQRYLTGS
jgi:AcrR family transcriptional regulator